MRLLYVSKHLYIKKADGSIFPTGAMGPEYFHRFLSTFDSVAVLGYVQEENQYNKLKTVGVPIKDTEKIRFLLVPCGICKLSALLANREMRTLAYKSAQNADIIACKNASGPYFAARIAKKANKPYLVEVVGCVRDALWNHGFLGKLLAYPVDLRLRRTIWYAPFVCYVTNEYLQKHYPTRGTSVGISDVVLPAADDSILERRLKMIQNHIGVWKIGTTGAVNVSYKGQQFVIEALAKLKAQGRTDFEYHLAGSGDFTRLKSLAKKLGVEQQVFFEGSIPHDKMFAWLDNLDLYLQPSLVEGMPRALIEAMSRALPCFGSNVGGIPELLDQSTTFPKKKSEAISDILALLTASELEKMAQRNFERSKEFEIAALAEKRNSFYVAFLAAYKENQK